MKREKHTSPQYYSQCVQRSLENLSQDPSWPIRTKANERSSPITFQYMQKDFSIELSGSEKRMTATIEQKTEKGYEPIFKVDVKIKKTKTQRLSPASCEQFVKDKILRTIYYINKQ